MGDDADTESTPATASLDVDDLPPYRLVDDGVGYPVAGMAVATSALALVVALVALGVAARAAR